ncbi:VOC family protein [Nigerium massiliense]|uniref:VOC family protein n=1 Tax=Nigerium massiliense TaxID=1522317 RepID=UPI00059098AC|nr:VOC family protein [Nigerium massiliense]
MSRPLGTPTWTDLGSTDLTSSKAFYQSLFGWTFHDSGEEYGHYNMISGTAGLVGGAMDVSAMTCPNGDPMTSSWDVYLEVDDVDARTKLATEHGAHVLAEPGDVGDAGRFSMVLDPTDAVVGLWQSGDTQGYAFTGGVGTPVWFELMTQRFQESVDFYTAVFDFKPAKMEGANYVTNGAGDDASSGICDSNGWIPAEMGSFWRLYLRVDDCDAAAQRVQELGGRVLDGPEDSPFGRLATVADPAGAMFMIIDTERTGDRA